MNNFYLQKSNAYYDKQGIYLVLALFIFFPFLSLLRSIIRGYYGGDILSLGIPVDEEIYYYFIFWILSTFIFINLLIYFIKIISRSNRYTLNFESNNVVHYFFFLLSLFLFIIVYFFNIGTIERVEGGRSRILELVFAAMQPYYVLIIYILFFYDKSIYLYKYTIALFFASVVFSGFIGYFFYIIPALLYLMRGFSKVKLIFTFIFAFLLMPLVRFGKFLYIKSFDENSSIPDLSMELYFAFSDIVIDRFSMISEINFWGQRGNQLDEFWNHSLFPIFQSYIGSFFYKAFNSGSVGNINGLAAGLITGTSEWNTVFPLISYFNISFEAGILGVFYSLFLVLIFIYFSVFLFKNGRIYFFVIIPSYLLLFGGWFWAFANLIQALLIVLFVFLVLCGFKRVKM